MKPPQERSAPLLISRLHPFKQVPQLTFALWELANNRHIQERLRAEIMETLGRIRARGDSDFTVNDFDSMPYLLAVGKVCWELVHLSMKIDLRLRIGSPEGLPSRD